MAFSFNLLIDLKLVENVTIILYTIFILFFNIYNQ